MRRNAIGTALAAVLALAATAALPGGAAAQRDSAFAHGGRIVYSTITALNLEPITIPLAGERQRIDKQLYLVIGVDAVDVGTADRMRAMRPRVTDAVLGDLYAFVNDGSHREWTETAFEQLKAVVRGAVERVVGRAAVREVAFGDAREVVVY